MATLAAGLENFDTGRGNETEEVAFSQLNYLYEMMKEECGKLRIQNKDLRIKNADLGDKVANYDKIRKLHESDLREQFARNTVQTKKELEASSSRVEELSKELTIVMIAHRLTTVQKCDRIISIECGKVLKEETPMSMI